MNDIWAATGTWYDNASGNSYSTLSRAKDALINTFGYSSIATQQFTNFNKIILEIDNNRPVIMDGASSDDPIEAYGHAWVCDGYFIKEYYRNTSGIVTSREEYLRMNWGLNDGDGYFATDNFVVTLSNGTTLNFNYDNMCIINIKPEIGILE
jgi:hypothetical protein